MVDHVADLCGFITDSPTSYHAAETIGARLAGAGFVELDAKQPWRETPRRGYVRVGGAVIAWSAPERWTPDTGLRLVASHTDSPALELKPNGAFVREGFQQVEVEVYGGPILHTWFDRDLAVAGRFVDLAGDVHLVRTGAIARVPQLAIHLDRNVNEELRIDAQRDLSTVFGLAGTDLGQVADELASGVGIAPEDVGGYDLFLVPSEAPAVIGMEQDFIASYRLDNLLSVHSNLVGFLQAHAGDHVQVYVAFDHEEIGSHTPTGASGPFLVHTLRRLSAANGFDEADHLAWLARGFGLSADVCHGVHPNRPDRHDPVVRPMLDAGPVLKWSAPMRYTSEASSEAAWTRACAAAGVASQVFVNNNTVRGGSSLGPLLATRLGLTTVDAGVAILSMHSARELASTRDPERFADVARAFLELY